MVLVSPLHRSVWLGGSICNIISCFVLQVFDSPYEDEEIEQMAAQHYEFPNGYNQDFGFQRFKIAEGLFDTGFIKVRILKRNIK